MESDVNVSPQEDGYLDSLVGSAQAQFQDSDGNVIPSPQQPGTEQQAGEPVGAQTGEASSAAGINTPSPAPAPQVGDAPQPGILGQTFNQQPQVVYQPDPQQAQQLAQIQQQMNSLTQRLSQSEEQRRDLEFERSIMNLEEDEQRVRRMQYGAQKLDQRNRYLQSQLQLRDQALQIQQQASRDAFNQQQEQIQNNAKGNLAYLIATDAIGREPTEREIRYLLTATDPNDMLALAGDLQGWTRTPVQQDVQVSLSGQSAAQNRPVDTAGLDSATASPIVRPARGSGDLDSLIDQTDYQYVAY